MRSLINSSSYYSLESANALDNWYCAKNVWSYVMVVSKYEISEVVLREWDLTIATITLAKRICSSLDNSFFARRLSTSAGYSLLAFTSTDLNMFIGQLNGKNIEKLQLNTVFTFDSRRKDDTRYIYSFFSATLKNFELRCCAGIACNTIQC